MKLTSTPISAIPVLLTLTPAAFAQFSGFIVTENRGSCPIPIREGFDTNYSWDPKQGDLCIKLDQDNVVTESYHASLLGWAETPDAVEPSKFGACRDEKCTDCEVIDIKRRTDRPGAVESECVEFDGEERPWVFVGGPVKEDL
ncbi:uncharacterized protein BDV17DRAFT_287391 [Aspergillus undulatus]|uniref:uncharacterized protein n=1 Tax=Aspergillus undulatus TaxID=1810928 RepID=UPI003CCD91AD